MEEEKAPPSPVPGPSSAPDVIADNAAVAKEDGDEGVLRDEDLGVQGWLSLVTSSNLLFHEDVKSHHMKLA